MLDKILNEFRQSIGIVFAMSGHPGTHKIEAHNYLVWCYFKMYNAGHESSL